MAEPLTDDAIRQRLVQTRERVAIDQQNVDRWTAERTYWQGKKDAAGGAETPELDAYLSKIGDYVTNTEGHLANSTAELDELVAIMRESGVPQEAPDG